MCGVSMRRCALYINRGATETAGHTAGALRGHPAAGVVHGVFPCRPCLLATIFFKISFSVFREILSPRGFELGARLLERLCRAIAVSALVGGRVKTALPAPLIDIDGDAGAGGDRPHLYVAKIDVPAVGAFGMAAAAEGGHGPWSRGLDRS
jgi:hypothetical protein